VDQLEVFWTSYIGFGVICTIAELVRPARKLRYAKAVPLDLVALAVYVFVTPRYHHIHHSSDADLHDGNYGAIFTIWDRLFGTYVAPDANNPKTFGTGEKQRDPVLLMIGI